MKSITIAGTVGKDAVIRNAGERRVTGWSVAVDDGWGENKRTIWFDCSWWGQRGEKVAQYITKGGKVAVTGSLSTREHDGKTYLTVDVQDVTLQGGGQDRQQGGQSDGGYGSQDRGGSQGGSYAGGGSRDMDDSIPFAPETRI